MPKTAKHLKAHQFKKGAPSPNPKGRPPLSPGQRELRKLSLKTHQEVIEMALTGTVGELKALATDPKTPAIQVGIATAILQAIKVGDPSVLERFMERIIGKIPDKLEVTSVSSVSIDVNAQIAVLTDADLKARMLRLESDV